MFDDLFTWIIALFGKAKSSSVSVTSEQNLTETQKMQARDNIDAVSKEDLNHVETYFMSVVENGIIRIRYVEEGSTFKNGLIDIQSYQVEGG